MAYSNETSSVKTIVPGAEVSGFCDVVARQKIGEVSAEVPKLSAGEGIGLSTVDGKTVITNKISAGDNISLVYDQETNTYRIDGEGGDLTNYYQKTETSSKQEISAALQYVSSNAGHTYTGVAPIQVNNTTDQISITGESLSAGPGIDMFSSGGYVVVSSTGKELSAGPGLELFESGGYFVMSATGVGGAGGTSAYYLTGSTNIFEDTMTINSDGVVTIGSYTPGQLVPTTNLTSDEGKFPMIYCRDGRSYYLLERVRQLPYYNAQTNGVVGMSAGSPAWVPMPNCYCIKLNNLTTSVDLSDYSAYDKVTVVNSQEGGDDCHLYWNGKTKVIHSANYCELVKVLDNNNNIKWTFTTSGWTNDNWWDWD